MDSFSIVYEGPHGKQRQEGIPLEITDLNLSRRMAKAIDLTPLEESQNLKRLNLSVNKLESVDLTSLENVTCLEELDLRQNKLKQVDLWPLRNLSSLQRIDLSENSLMRVNLSSVIQTSEVCLDRYVNVEIESTLRYILSGKDLSRIVLCSSFGNALQTTPKIKWIGYDIVVERHGWKRAFRSILHFLNRSTPRNSFFLQRGILEGLDMPEIVGIDEDPRLLFSECHERMSYEEARNAIYDKAIELIERQLERGGSTLFFDANGMARTRASKVIKQLLDARIREMQDLYVGVGGSLIDLLPLWLTHYGSKILQALGCGMLIDKKGFEQIADQFNALGYSIKTKDVDFERVPQTGRFSQSLLDYVYIMAVMG